MWYAAHVIMAFRYREGSQQTFPVYENVFLIEADSSRAAHDRAVEIGRAEASYDDPSLTYNEVAVRKTFEGVRKVVQCDPPDRIASGSEVTYSEISVTSEEDLRRLVAGEQVTVEYE